jgi:hypothetical protein
MKFVLKSSTGIPVCEFKLYFKLKQEVDVA